MTDERTTGWCAPADYFRREPWHLPTRGMSKKKLRKRIRYLEEQLRAAGVPEPEPLDLPIVSIARGGVRGVRYPGDRP